MSATCINTNPKANKEHYCDACNRIIDKGEKYLHQAQLDNGTVQTYRECAHCAALVRLWSLWSCCDDGYNGNCFTEHYSRDVTDLRWQVQYRRRWRRRDGNLYPIPQVAS